MKLGTAMCVALATVAITGRSASAKIIETIVKGTVISGTNDGVFGKQADLAGDKYTAVYIFNDDLGTRETEEGYFDGVNYLSGLTTGSTPLISAYLDIKGHDAYTNGTQYFSDLVSGGIELQIAANEDTMGSGYEFSFVDNSVLSTKVPSSLDRRFSASVTPAEFNNDFLFAQGSLYANGTLDPTHVRVEVLPGTTAAVPEPSTWLLMIAGIGGIGMMLRQAKSKMGFRFKDAFTARPYL